MPLTEKDREAIRFIREYFQKNGVAPSYSDIVKGFGLSSKSHAQHRIKILERKGYLKRTPGLMRSLELVDGSMKHGAVVQIWDKRFKWRKEVLA